MLIKSLLLFLFIATFQPSTPRVSTEGSAAAAAAAAVAVAAVGVRVMVLLLFGNNCTGLIYYPYS